MLIRPAGYDGGKLQREVMPGDVLAGGESLLAGALTTAGAGTWTGAQIATGIINRTGPVGAYADATDTAANIVAALQGNYPGLDIVPGTTFRMLLINTVAFALTLTPGAGVITGGGTINVAASLVREYLWTILNASAPVTMPCSLVTATKVLTFILPPGSVSIPLVGSNGANGAVAITTGMTVSGTGITAGTRVAGVTQGQGGAIGVTLDTNAASTQALTSLTFGPTLKLDGLRSSTL